MAGTQRAHILIPGDLLQEIDDLVGPRGRSAFLLETARQEVQRRKLLRFLESEQPAWKTEDHPELDGGAAAYIKRLRRQSEKREAAEHPRSLRKQPIAGRESSVKRSFVKPNRSK